MNSILRLAKIRPFFTSPEILSVRIGIVAFSRSIFLTQPEQQSSDHPFSQRFKGLIKRLTK